MTTTTINANTANDPQSTIAAAIEAARAAAAEAAEAAKKAREKAEEADEAETNANSAEDEAENDLYAAENASSEAAEAEERAQTAASEAEEAAREAENASTEAAEAEENAREHAAEATKAANLARTAAAEAAEAAEIAEQAAARAAEAIAVAMRAAAAEQEPELEEIILDRRDDGYIITLVKGAATIDFCGEHRTEPILLTFSEYGKPEPLTHAAAAEAEWIPTYPYPGQKGYVLPSEHVQQQLIDAYGPEDGAQIFRFFESDLIKADKNAIAELADFDQDDACKSEPEPEEHRARCCITDTILKRFFPEPIASDINETQTFMGTILKPKTGKTATLIIDPDLLDHEINWSYPDDPGAFIDLSTGEIITSHERPEEIAAIVDRIIIAAIQQDADRTRIARRDAQRRFSREVEKRADAHDIEYDYFEATTGNPNTDTDDESTWYGMRFFERNNPLNSLEIPPANFADPTETAPIFARLETWFFRTAEQRAWEEDE